MELGPSEGAPTYTPERAGGDVLSIEGNHGAFLCFLIVKNFLDLKSKFLLGGFSNPDITGDKFDTVVDSRVLNRMEDPVVLLEKVFP